MPVESFPNSGPLVYVTLAQASDYGLDVTDEAAATSLLVKAQREIDAVLSVGEVGAGPEDLRIDPATLMPWQSRRLARAVAAQGEYRIEMGDAFFSRDQYDAVTGPDFTAKGRLSRIAPRAIIELYGTGLATWLPAPEGAPLAPGPGGATGWARIRS